MVLPAPPHRADRLASPLLARQGRPDERQPHGSLRQPSPGRRGPGATARREADELTSTTEREVAKVRATADDQVADKRAVAEQDIAKLRTTTEREVAQLKAAAKR